MDWQPIDTAPKDGTPIVGLRIRKYPDGSEYPDGEVMMWEGCGISECGWAFMGIMVRMVDDKWLPTHWLPLPSPPENFESGANAAANSPAPEVSAAATRTATTEIGND